MRSVKFLLAGLTAAVLMSGTAADAKDISVLQKTGNAFSEIAKQALPAVVFIDVESTVEVQVPRYQRSPFDDFFGRGSPYGDPYDQRTRKYHQQGQGSGFIITKDGYILTNNHVVDNADSITVTLADGREFDAVLVGTDPKTEVALIKIEDEADLPFLEMGDSDALQVGEWVLAAGNPFGLSQTITAGIVSAKERRTGMLGADGYENFIQTDAAINPGNSGGPLLNIHGRVVGINTAIYSQTGGYMGIGFAIPINLAIPIKDQLVEYGRVNRSVLGVYIQEVDEDLAESFGLDDAGGILISQVKEDSAAEKAGLQAGDIVVELDGEPVGKLAPFRSRIAATPPNTPVNLKIFRDGDYVNVSAITQAMDGDEAASADEGPAVLEKLGLSVQEIDQSRAEQLGLPNYGVMISAVEEGSLAWRAGLRHGQVILSANRIRIESVEVLNQILDEASESRQVLFRVSDGRGARYVVLPLN